MAYVPINVTNTLGFAATVVAAIAVVIQAARIEHLFKEKEGRYLL